MTPAETAVDCPQCLGRSVVDTEYRHLPLWACPFCGGSNPMPPGEPAPGETARRWWPAAAATIVVAIVVGAGLAAQSSIPRGDYRTIEGLTDALAVRGMPCGSLASDPAPPPGVRAAAACTIGSAPVWLVTFGTEAKRDRHLRATPPGMPAAVGRTWMAVTRDEALARRIASAFGARYQPAE